MLYNNNNLNIVNSISLFGWTQEQEEHLNFIFFRLTKLNSTQDLLAICRDNILPTRINDYIFWVLTCGRIFSQYVFNNLLEKLKNEDTTLAESLLEKMYKKNSLQMNSKLTSPIAQQQIETIKKYCKGQLCSNIQYDKVTNKLIFDNILDQIFYIDMDILSIDQFIEKIFEYIFDKLWDKQKLIHVLNYIKINLNSQKKEFYEMPMKDLVTITKEMLFMIDELGIKLNPNLINNIEEE